MVSIRIVGVTGSSPRAAVMNRAGGREVWVDWVRQGVVELVVFGEMVNVIA